MHSDECLVSFHNEKEEGAYCSEDLNLVLAYSCSFGVIRPFV